MLSGGRDDDADALFACAKEDALHNLGSQFFDKKDFDRSWGIGRWRAVPRLAPHQRGKLRPIDDARRGGHNDATTIREKIVLCNAAQPTLDTRALAEAAARCGLQQELAEHTLESGGEDMPNAFRTVPCAPEDLDVNIM